MKCTSFVRNESVEAYYDEDTYFDWVVRACGFLFSRNNSQSRSPSVTDILLMPPSGLKSRCEFSNHISQLER